MSAQIEKYLGLDIIQQIPQKINDMTNSLVTDLTGDGGSLEEVRSNLRTALDDVNDQFDVLNDTFGNLTTLLNTNWEKVENVETFRQTSFAVISALIIVIGLSGVLGVLFPSSTCGLILLRCSIALRRVIKMFQ